MGILDNIIKVFEEEKKREEFFAKQQMQQMSLARRKEEYWLVALTLDEAIKANHLSLQVEIPSVPKMLMSPNYNQFFATFDFVLKRTLSNTPCSNNPTLPHEVKATLTDYFRTCGYSGFSVECREDTYRYYVTVNRLNGFCFGGVLSSNIGAIRYDGRYYVALYQGGFPLISPTTILRVYRFGLWHRSGICFDDMGYPYLACSGEPLDNYCGCIASI